MEEELMNQKRGHRELQIDVSSPWPCVAHRRELLLPCGHAQEWWH